MVAGRTLRDTDRPGLRPRLHSYTDEASRPVGVAGVIVRVPVVTDNVGVGLEVTVRRVREQAVVRLEVALVRVWTLSVLRRAHTLFIHHHHHHHLHLLLRLRHHHRCRRHHHRRRPPACKLDTRRRPSGPLLARCRQ